MKDTLMELDEVFYEARSKVLRKEDESRVESEVALENLINELQNELKGILKNYPFSSDRLFGNIRDTLTELRFAVRNITNKNAEELVDTAVQLMKSAQSQIEEERAEENVPLEERQDEEKRIFDHSGKTMGEEYDEANKDSNYDRIKDFAQETKSNVLRNIGNYIEYEGGAMAFGLNIGDVEDLKDMIDQKFSESTNDLQQLYQDTLENVNKVISEQFKQIMDFAEKQLKERQDEKEVPKEEPKPWDLENYGTTREEANEKIARATKETMANDKSSQDRRKTLADLFK